MTPDVAASCSDIMVICIAVEKEISHLPPSKFVLFLAKIGRLRCITCPALAVLETSPS